MNKNQIMICLFILVLGSVSIVPFAYSSYQDYIPPTRAFEKFWMGLTHIEAGSYLGGINYTCTGCTITGTNGTTRPSINFNIAASNTPLIVSTVSLLNQTSNIGSTTLYTAVNSGTYRVSVYQIDVQSAIAGTLGTTISWTDESNAAQTLKPAADVNVALLHGFSQGSIFIDVKAGSAIKYTTSLSGVTGSPLYNLMISTEKLS